MLREPYNFKKYFSYRELWEKVIKVPFRKGTYNGHKRIAIDSFQVFYHDKINHETHIIYTSSELACWRIIDLAVFMLRFDAGETDLTFPERHKLLEKKAFLLAFGNDYYDPNRFTPTSNMRTQEQK